MGREEHIRLRQEAIRRKKERREKQLALEASRNVKPDIEWHFYPDYDPVAMVKHRIYLVENGIKIYAHDDERYAIYK